LAAPPRAPAGAGIFLIRAVGRAARLPRAHGARPSLGRGRTRRSCAAQGCAGGVAVMFGDTGLQPTPFVPAKAGTPSFLDSRFRGNERNNGKAAPNRNRRDRKSVV